MILEFFVFVFFPYDFFLWHIGCLGGWFNFQVFMNVLDSFLLLISNFIPLSL